MAKEMKRRGWSIKSVVTVQWDCEKRGRELQGWMEKVKRLSKKTKENKTQTDNIMVITRIKKRNGGDRREYGEISGDERTLNLGW